MGRVAALYLDVGYPYKTKCAKLTNYKHSIVEHDVALIVGCMPAFAAFIKAQSLNPTIFSTLRTKIFGGSVTSTPKPNAHTREPDSIGDKRNPRRNRSHYYELDDSILNTQTTNVTIIPTYEDPVLQASTGEDRGILKTTNISREFH